MSYGVNKELLILVLSKIKFRDLPPDSWVIANKMHKSSSDIYWKDYMKT